MIRFKYFVEAIHQAISGAADILMDKNQGLLEKYFYREARETSPDQKDDKDSPREIYKPKTVTLDYPSVDEEGHDVTSHVEVPLITLVPVTSSQIEKATFTADFQLSIIDDDLYMDFPDSKKKNQSSTIGKLEIVISPKETTEGLQQIIEGYEKALKRQI